MSTIHDTELLKVRAIEHQKADHIAAGAYGVIDFITNGEIETTTWRGCAIGCLATAGSLDGVLNQVKNGEIPEYEVSITEDKDTDKVFYHVNSEPDTLRELLERQFGICTNLSYVAEIVFEGVAAKADGYYHDEDRMSKLEEYYKSWPVKFANALEDGLVITDFDVKNWWDDVVDAETPLAVNEHYDDYHGTWGIDDYFDFGDIWVGEALIRWIESLKAGKSEELAVA